MATEAVAAAGAAIALYWWRRERVLCGPGGQSAALQPRQDPVRFSQTHQPPSTWMEVRSCCQSPALRAYYNCSASRATSTGLWCRLCTSSQRPSGTGLLPQLAERLTAAEAPLCRFAYGETLGRWRTADLLIGLAYLARREKQEHPVADIAQHGTLFGLGAVVQPSSEVLVRMHSRPACAALTRSLTQLSGLCRRTSGSSNAS